MLRHRLMGASLSIQATIRQAKPFDRAAMEKVFADNLFDVLNVNKTVPDSLRVDHHNGPVLALVEAAGLVGTNVVLQTSFLDCVLECSLQLLAAIGQATWPGGALVTFVGTDKDVAVKLRHLWRSLPFSRSRSRMGRAILGAFLRQ